MNILNFDSQLTHTIYSLPHNSILDTIFHFFSISGIFVVLWALLFLLVIAIEENRHHRFIFSFLISTVSSAILTNIVLKNLFLRPRPLSLLSLANYPTDFSFPSGHATFAFAAAYVLAQYDKKRALYFYGIAVLIAFSRVYLGFHYVGDVLVGSLIGVAVSWLSLYSIDKKYA